MSEYHEPESELSGEVRDLHRALASLKEEIEAVDWYNQRVVLCSDRALAKVLAHNRDEEIEHACMTLEWLRRNVPAWDEQLRAQLFTDGNGGDIASHDAPEPGSGGGGSEPLDGSLNIGSLKVNGD